MKILEPPDNPLRASWVIFAVPAAIALIAAIAVFAYMNTDQHLPKPPAHEGTEEFHGWDVSRLMHGVRTDSYLWVNDQEIDGNAVWAKGYGCGRWWKVVAKYDNPGDTGHRETDCNLTNHFTGEVVGPNGAIDWSSGSNHN